MRILVTGASGLLGRAVMDVFRARAGWETIGTALSRTAGGLERLDLCDAEALGAALDRWRPDVIVHAAAERRPDVSERDPERTRHLNVDATAALAGWAGRRGAGIITVSTDYVFDGTRPPYAPGDAPHPLNAYGRSKLAAEQATLAECPGGAVVRVPILYGDVETLEESAVTVVAAHLLARPPEPLPVDNWAIRYPTHVGDVALALAGVVEHRETHPEFGGVLHVSGTEPYTKYAMAVEMARCLGVDAGRLLSPDDRPAPAAAPRPRDCHLDCRALARLGIGATRPFVPAIARVLARFRT